ncbi:MAG: hypothetical protein EI684_12785 [Candidatus Viridilinea halotolerans]|uniref:Uncharacterized protein n=1 Tax=Candidatus Viridilinea halotolerans TaxID=2491704 RepID=A0A426TXZ0_9CHLR|nr:MAG: hypothetical protein EI684_12785 [Candidatus Viridilinea halotolerans]
MSTLDLLLELGGKLADLTNTLTQRRLSKEEQQLVQFSAEYKDLMNVYGDVQRIIQFYNVSLANCNMQNLHNICDHYTCKRAEEHIRNLHYQNIVKEDLGEIRFISISLTKDNKEIIRFFGTEVHTGTKVEVYTQETWHIFCNDGSSKSEYPLNRYILALSDSGWKVTDSQVFTRVS